MLKADILQEEEELRKKLLMEINQPVLISPTQAMKILGVGRNTMYENLLKREDFPAFQIGVKYFINREKLQSWADKQCLKN